MDFGMRGAEGREKEKRECWEVVEGGADGGGCRGWYGTTTTGTDNFVLDDLDISLL